ncbi:MAG: FtsX-like permease family protein [Promicromonosporaceae bacterium]|nr:FtsX-like permease family protein [Promicromonosporaceae bacterium]
MSALVTLGLRLARAGGPLRAWSVALGNAFGAFLVLLTFALPEALYPDPARRADVRVNLVASLLFLVVPAVVLLVTVGRLSSGVRDRRLAALRMIGVTPVRVRVVAAVENGVLAAGGAVAGAVLFLVAAPPVGAAVSRGPGWLKAPLTLPPGTVALVTVAIVILSVVLGTAATWQRELPTAGRSESTRRAPSPWRLVVLAGGARLLVVVDRLDSTAAREATLMLLLVVGVLVTAVGIAIMTPLVTGWVADALLARRPSVGITLAARSMQSDAVGASRVVAGLGVAVFLITGGLGFMGFIAHLPHLRAADLAYGTGPQQIIITASSGGGAVPAAALDGVANLSFDGRSSCS